MTRLYLDHAATTTPTAAARAAMADGLTRWANPSSPHAEGRAARAALEEARRRIAAAHGWTGEVVLTSGATESLHLAFNRAAVDTRIVTSVEHDAVMRLFGLGVALEPVDERGLINLHTLDDLLPRPTTGGSRALMCIQYANSETGVRQDVAKVAEKVHATGNLLLVDAAQMPAVCAAEVAAHADFVALSAHKHGGPPGIGALLVRDLGLLTPSGGQERGYRPGTENLPAALGWAAALAEPEPVERWTALRARLDDAIARSGGEVVGAGSPRHPAIGSYRMPGTAAAAQLIRFDMAGIAVSAGSACSSGSLKPSHVMNALGYSDEAGREVIRISFGRDTGDADVDRAIAAWRDTARATSRFAA